MNLTLDDMKHLMTAMMCCGLLLSAPWPDLESRRRFQQRLIGLNDLLALLTVYGNEWTVDAGDDAEFDIAAYYAGGNGLDAMHHNEQVQQRCNHKC